MLPSYTFLFQVVSALGDTVARQPRSQVLVLSSDILPDILSVTHVNPDLTNRRWFAVGASHMAGDLVSSGRGRGLTSAHVRLTTLAYLGHPSDEDRRQKYLESAFIKDGSRDSVYSDWLVYNSVFDKIASGNIETDNEKIFVSLSLKTNRDIITVPDLPWLAETMITVEQGVVSVQDIKTVSLNMTDISQSVAGQCADPKLHYTAAGHLYLPHTSVTSALDDGRILIVPIMSNVSISVTCAEDSVGFQCHPSDTPGHGDVMCTSTVASDRPKRDLNDDDLSSIVTVSEEVTVVPVVGDYLKNASDHFDTIIESWRELTPSVVGCFASLAGE